MPPFATETLAIEISPTCPVSVTGYWIGFDKSKFPTALTITLAVREPEEVTIAFANVTDIYIYLVTFGVTVTIPSTILDTALD